MDESSEVWTEDESSDDGLHSDMLSETIAGSYEDGSDDGGSEDEWTFCDLKKPAQIKLVDDPFEGDNGLLKQALLEWKHVQEQILKFASYKHIPRQTRDGDLTLVFLLRLFLTDVARYIKMHTEAVVRRENRPGEGQEVKINDVWGFINAEVFCALLKRSPTDLYDQSGMFCHIIENFCDKDTYFRIFRAMQKPLENEHIE